MNWENPEYCVQEIFFWQKHLRADWFSAKFINLYRGSDSQNKARLKKGFPILCQMIEAWEEAGDNGNDLYREFGILKK